MTFLSLVTHSLQNYCGDLRSSSWDYYEFFWNWWDTGRTQHEFSVQQHLVSGGGRLMLLAVAGCLILYVSGTLGQLLWIRDGTEQAKEKWHFVYSERAPHNSPLNQLICSGGWLGVLWLYLVHAGMKKKKKRKKERAYLCSRLCRFGLWASFSMWWVVLWTFVYPGSYLFTWVLLLLTRNNGHSLSEPRHTTALLFSSSAVCFIFVLFLQVAYCTLSSLSCHYLWLAAVI